RRVRVAPGKAGSRRGSGFKNDRPGGIIDAARGDARVLQVRPTGGGLFQAPVMDAGTFQAGIAACYGARSARGRGPRPSGSVVSVHGTALSAAAEDLRAERVPPG